MAKKKNNSTTVKTQNNLNDFTETTSSEQQRDVGSATSPNSQKYTEDINFGLIEYRMKLLEENVDELKKEIQQPILKKIEKYKWILGIATGILMALITWAWNLHNKNLENKFDRLNEKHVENRNILEEQAKEIAELKSKIQIIEYSIRIPIEKTK